MNTSIPVVPDALLRQAAALIDAADARLLLAHAAARSPAWLLAHGREALPLPACERFDALVAARAEGRPVAYLLGRREFWTLQLEVTPDTLIPRPETERLVELALERLPSSGAVAIADLGTGSGAIALALASERPEARVVATDASAPALAVARANAVRNGLENVEFRLGHWLQPLACERFQLIASNPPYVAEGDPHLAQGDLRFEPAAALASGPDGLDAIRHIVANAPANLQPGGWLLIEHGCSQGHAVRELLLAAGLEEVTSERDLEARERVTLGRRAR